MASAPRVPQTPRDPMQSPASTSGQPNGTHTRNLYDSIDDDYGAPDSSRSRGKGGKPRATGGSNKSSQNTSPYHTARSHIEREEAAVYAQAGPAPRTTTDSQTSPAPAPARPSASHMGQAGRAAFAAFTAAAKAAAVDAEAAARSRRTTAATLGDGNSDTCVSPARGVITPPTSNHVTPTNATATNHSNRSSNSQLRAQQQQAASSSHNQGPGAYTRGESFSSVGKGGCSTPGLTANDSATSSKRFPTVPQPPVTRTQSHSMWAVHIEQGAQNLEGVLGPLVEAMVVDSGVSDTLPDTPWSALVSLQVLLSHFQDRLPMSLSDSLTQSRQALEALADEPQCLSPDEAVAGQTAFRALLKDLLKLVSQPTSSLCQGSHTYTSYITKPYKAALESAVTYSDMLVSEVEEASEMYGPTQGWKTRAT